MRRGQYDVFGLFGVEELPYGSSVEKVQFGVSAAYEIGVTFGFQVAPDGRTYQSAMTGYVDFRILIQNLNI